MKLIPFNYHTSGIVIEINNSFQILYRNKKPICAINTSSLNAFVLLTEDKEDRRLLNSWLLSHGIEGERRSFLKPEIFSKFIETNISFIKEI